MVLGESFSKDWILEKKKNNPLSNPILIEKMIYALFLVELHLRVEFKPDYYIKDPEYNFLNKTKGTPGGALFYWYHSVALLGIK